MGLGKWIALGAGIAGTAFTGNPGFAMAGVSAFNALGNKDATNKAVGQQQTATNQALDANERALGGYMQRGNTAGNALQGLMGLGPLPGSQGAATPGTLQSMATPPPVPTGQSGPMNDNGFNPDNPDHFKPIPRMQLAPDGTSSPASLATIGSQSSYQPGGQRMSGGFAGGGLVKAPDGRVVMVPPGQMQEAIRNGGVAL